MSDEQTLLAVIAVIYLIDCLFWIPRSGLGFTRWLGKSWRIREPSTTIGNDRGALGLANPLPPLGLATRAAGWTISISEHGVFSYTSAGFNPGGRPRQKSVFWAWPKITSISRDGKKLLINNEHFATAVSEYSARWLAQEIARLQKLGDKKRSHEIEAAIATSCNPTEVTRGVEGFLKQTRMLRYLANWLFVFLFVACPFLVWKLGIVKAIWAVVIGIYAQTILIALLFSKLHRKIYPADSEQILKPFLIMLLAAPSAIRAQDILGRPLLEPFHPLAAAKALCSQEEYDRLASIVVRDLHFPRMPVTPPDSPDKATETESGFRKMLLKQFNDPKWLNAPERTETVHSQYCPRCLQQFTDAGTTCPDCGGRPLVKF
jgi:hypothetical protein